MSPLTNHCYFDRAFPLAPNDESQLPGRTDGVECRTFRLFGRGACPETPHSLVCVRVPKRPIDFVTPWACKLTGSVATIPLSQRQAVTSRAAVRID
jgi:hypothetical protein